MSFTFAPTEFAQSIKALVDGGFQNASSVGFIPMERQGNTITKAQLLEVSLVPVPANQQALMLAAKSFESKGVAAEVVEKFVATLTEKEVEVEFEVPQKSLQSQLSKLNLSQRLSLTKLLLNRLPRRVQFQTSLTQKRHQSKSGRTSTSSLKSSVRLLTCISMNRLPLKRTRSSCLKWLRSSPHSRRTALIMTTIMHRRPRLSVSLLQSRCRTK